MDVLFEASQVSMSPVPVRGDVARVERPFSTAVDEDKVAVRPACMASQRRHVNVSFLEWREGEARGSQRVVYKPVTEFKSSKESGPAILGPTTVFFYAARSPM